MSTTLKACRILLSKEPELGDVIWARELGLRGYGKRIWHACIKCEKQRWVPLRNGVPKSLRCKQCGSKYRKLRGGGKYKSEGYVWVLSKPNDFFYPMANANGYIAGHRLVIAKRLGRCLEHWEIVHHRNHIRDDNRVQNLQLLPDKGTHMVDMKAREYIKRLEINIAQLEGRVTLLEAENILLRQEDSQNVNYPS